MVKKLTYTDVLKSFETEGYQLLSKEYVNSSTPVKYVCPQGHTYQVTWNKWQGGRRCPYCTPGGRVRVVDIEYIRSKFAEEGYKLLIEVYTNCDTKLKCTCPEGHTVYISWDAWQSKGTRCAECSGTKKHSFGDVDAAFSSEGFTLLSTDYKNVHSKLKYRCPVGHEGTITFSNWKAGNRCRQCSGKIKHSLEFIKKEFEVEGYKLLTKKYVNGKQKLSYICPKNHRHSMVWNNWQQGQRCPSCLNLSKGEKELAGSIRALGIYIIRNDRTIIAPYELDIFIPSKKIAIEYCGLYWHSEGMGKNSTYHKNKLDMCQEKGIRLITVFEDEWLIGKDIVISMLKSILGIYNTTLHANECKVKEISEKEAKDFYQENHLQGYGVEYATSLGAFYDNTLVSVMTFSNAGSDKVTKATTDDVWELYRFCSKKEHEVVNVTSKLLKYFEKNYRVKELVAYADRRWSVGNMYYKLGFSFSHKTRPNYWYFRGSKKRMVRFSKIKISDEPKHISEWRLRQDEGWNRVWDCGNLKFIKILGEKSYV